MADARYEHTLSISTCLMDGKLGLLCFGVHVWVRVLVFEIDQARGNFRCMIPSILGHVRSCACERCVLSFKMVVQYHSIDHSYLLIP